MAEHLPVTTPENSVHGYETTDISVSAVLWFLGGLAVVMALSGVFLWWLFGFMQARVESADLPPSPVARDSLPPPPRLQKSPSSEMQELRAQETAHLSEYGWSSREQRTVHIPIDEAMNRVVREGLPKWPSIDPPAKEGSQK